MINEQDYTKTEKDGVITFTPKKKDVTGERSMLKRGSDYWDINCAGIVSKSYDQNYFHTNDTFAQGNYYHTEEQAQAVADLRRHVYKFPAVRGDTSHYVYDWNGTRSVSVYHRDMQLYFLHWLPITATDEDQEERTRLIKRCYELNGYVTI